MPTSPMPDELRDLVAQPNPAVMATLRSNGHPVSVATWYMLDGDRLFVNLEAGRTRLQHLRNDPRVALTVMDADNWYTHVSFQGHVVEIADDDDLAGIDRLSRHYRGSAYPVRDRARVNAWIEIDRWHGWGEAQKVQEAVESGT